MRKYIITAELRDLENQVHKAEISYSRMIEILCEKADKYAKNYQELDKLIQDNISYTETVREKITEILYKNSSDDSECLRIKFENIETIIDEVVKCLK